MKILVLIAASAAFAFGAFADRSASISVDWRGLPNVDGILRDNSKAHYGFANFVAFGPGWQFTAQDYAAKEHKKDVIEDPKYGKGLLFTGRIWAGKTGLRIREEYYDVSKGGKAKAHVRWTISNDDMGKPMKLERAYVRFPLSRAEFAGGKAGPNVLPDTYGDEWIGVGNKDDIRIVSKDGKKALIAKVITGNPVVQDARKDKQDRFEFRIDFPNQKEGSSSTIEFEIAGSFDESVVKNEGKVKLDLPPPPVKMVANDDWVVFPFENRINAGSILDFSGIGTLDAPAGKYGFVKVNKEGHFSFEKHPEGVRFIGGNLCFDANFLTKEQCKAVVDDFVKRGWNTVRFHHIDVTITKDQWNNLWGRTTYPEISLSQLDKLDYLMSEFKKAGVYATFDLYAMGGLGSCEGFDKPLNSNTIKAIVPVHKPAEDLWFKRAMEIFDHVNPYTGLKWKDDPAVLFVTLMNEDSINSVWWGAADKYFAEYEKWAGKNGRPKVDRKKAGESKDFAEFMFTLKAEANRRMTRRLKEAGVRALCSGGNWWDTMPQTYEREALEVVDNHGYGDHPQPSYQKIPFHINQVSDIKSGNPTYNQPLMKAPTRIFGKPFTITEYNYCTPNRWRADGGVMMGAYSSLQDWDALYRFAWSHSNANMFKQCAVKGFDIVTDPIGQLTEKQIVLMFGRRDVAPAKNAVAYAVKKDDAMEKGLGDMWAKGLFPHPFTQYAMVSRIGSFTADNGEKPAIECAQVWDRSTKGSIPKHTGVSVSDTKEIRIDTRKGDMTVATPRTAAVCSIDKNDLAAGPLAVSGASTFCSVSASAMDSAALVDSKKVLVLHITDVLNTDMVFTNAKMTDPKAWGTMPYLARAGKADISLKNSNAGLSVYALASDGSRLRKVPAKYVDGAYVFTAEVKAGEGKSAPTMMYELAR